MKEEDFKKLTKSQKLAMKQEGILMGVECSRVLFLPIKRKNDGYGMSACFIETKRGWLRVTDYDCFRFNNPEYRVKGDFEHGGVCFFGGFVYDYGNDFKCLPIK
jgi:hypothetical protein